MGGQAYLVAASVTIVLLVLVIIFLFVIRWKIAFSVNDGEQAFHLVPSGVVDKNTRSFKKLKKQLSNFARVQEKISQSLINENKEVAYKLIASDDEIRKTQEKSSQALRAVLSTLRDLREETKILREEIQNQAQELDRHRKGYDVDILSTSLIPISRMHRLLIDELSRNELSDEARVTLEALNEECLDVIELKGVRLEYPKVGERYRNQQNIQHPPILVPTSDAEAIGQIANVVKPAYELDTSVRTVVLLAAVVEVYSAERKASTVKISIIETSNVGENNG